MKKTLLIPQKKILALKQTSCQILAWKRLLKTSSSNSKYFPLGHRRPVFNGYLFMYHEPVWPGAAEHSSGAVHCLMAGASVRMQNQVFVCLVKSGPEIWTAGSSVSCMSCLTAVLLDTSAGHGLIYFSIIKISFLKTTKGPWLWNLLP